jgi:hypothetical protein
MMRLSVIMPAPWVAARTAQARRARAERVRRTSGPNVKIGSNPFSNLTFGRERVTIGGADLATVLDRKCRQ